MIALQSNSSSHATPNPTIGESNSDRPTPAAWVQSTPLVPCLGFISWFAMPTPMIEPTMVCELEAGNPKYQVPRFQRIAAINKRKNHRKARAAAYLQDQLHRQQSDDGECNGATGKQDADEVPRAGPRHGQVRLHGMRIDDRCNSVGSIVEAIHELETERDQTAPRPARCTGR